MWKKNRRQKLKNLNISRTKRGLVFERLSFSEKKKFDKKQQTHASMKLVLTIKKGQEVAKNWLKLKQSAKP